MVYAEIWGGAGEHGRSCYYVRQGRHAVLLDCGVKKEGSGEYPLLDPSKVKQLSTVFLSHAHEDHSIALPLLYRYGYTGDIWTTRVTEKQAAAYFAKWSQYVHKSAGTLPYEAADVARLRYRYLEDEAEEGVWFEVEEGLEACWGPSGHMLGSVWVMLRMDGEVIYYSGDYSVESRLLEASLPPLDKKTDITLAIVDAAYGAGDDTQPQLVQKLLNQIRHSLERGGQVWLPVPAVGRGQELMLIVSEAFPDVPLLCDERLQDGLAELASYADWCRTGELSKLERLQQHRIRAHSPEALIERSAEEKGPVVLFTSDPMLQSDPALALYERVSARVDNAIIMTGHVYKGSRAAHLLEVAHQVPCMITASRYKIHQGLPDVRRMLDALQPQRTLLVHAERSKTDQLRDQLRQYGYKGVHSCSVGDRLH